MNKPLATLASIGLASIMSLAVCGAAFARPDTRTMSCGQARSLVLRHGAIVLTTGPHTYDRFVSDGGYCDSAYGPQIAYVQTRDFAQCPVGYRCVNTDLLTPPFED